MGVFFIILFVVANELTYMVAAHQKLGLCKHISAGDLCWINRIMLIVPCIWYCGWIAGIILFLFSLFGLLHASIGWILSLPTAFVNSEETMFLIGEIECNLLIPINIICLIFTIISFFLSSFMCVFNMFNSLSSVIILFAVLIVGFFARVIVSHCITGE